MLGLTSEPGSSTGIFSGTVTAADGKYCLWYFGNPVKDENNADTNPYVSIAAENGVNVANFNISNQSFKSTEELSAFDVMYKPVDVVVSNGTATVAENVDMNPLFAMVRFSLSGLPSEASGILAIKEGDSTGENVTLLTPQYNLADGARIGTGDSNPMVITVNPVEAGEDVYVALLPKAYSLDFTFTNSADNKVYTSKITSNALEAGKYYCVLPGEGETGLSGIKVSMTEQNNGGNDYPGYENEDPRNPLHKFAKYNLTRGENNLNVFVENDETYGALYQWGRYYGFIDRNDKTVFGKYNLSSKTYTQFADALGSKRVDGSDIWGYSVYDPDGSNMYRNPNYDDGSSMYEYVPIVVGLNYRTGNGVNFDYPMMYNTKAHLVTDQPYYYMDGTYSKFISLQRHGSRYPAYVDEYTNTGDYWVEDFGEGGSDWTTRAKAQGFATDKENPCPDGWRLPSSDEMKEIIPENGLYKKNGNLSNMLNNYCEVRKSMAGYWYVIRWKYASTNNYIEIEAVVVDESYKDKDASQLSTAFWDQHKDDKVVRKFPFTGGIRPYTGYVYGSSTWDTVICRPISMGKPTFESFTVGWVEAVGLVTPNETGGINEHFGGYWVNEKDWAFKFCAENFEREVNGNVRETESEYTRVRMEQTGPAFGMAIRPVMAK